jgi:D-serine deaminase-like pyridoxal phosphate-dependent protein
MSREFPQPEGVARPQAPYSSVVVDGDLVYTAGQVAFGETGQLVPGGMEEQVRPSSFPAGSLEFLTAAVEGTARAGVATETVSIGGTPGMWSVEAVRPTVTEYRAGTYAFHDRATVAAGAAILEHVALTICATVVSRPTRDRAILDAGSKSLSSDRSAADGFGLVLEAPESTLVRVDEEHGYLQLANGDDVRLGQQVRIVPNHACAVSNLFAAFVLTRDGELAGRWTVDARGR